MSRKSTAKNERPGGKTLLPIDSKQALELVMELMAIPGKSGEEQGVVDFITRHLLAAGAKRDQLETDSAHHHTPLKGQTGNLILKLPGTKPGPRRMLTAHMDTVPICVGSQPVKKGDVVRSANPQTGLGADDRAGAATILMSAIEILRKKLPHPPLTFCWFIQEEIGLYGARFVQKSKLGSPKMAFNWDGGSAIKLTTGATGGYRMHINVRGLASHAGVSPEKGVSAIAIASLAIAKLVREGWHGDIRKGNKRGTSNIGIVRGGDATNVVTDHVYLKAEARSHDPAFRKLIVQHIEKAFREACTTVRNVEGIPGNVEFEGQLDYEAFRLAEDEPCVLAAEAAVRARGKEPFRAISNGGLDANWLSSRGIPTVSLGCGQSDPHTIKESLKLEDFYDACRIALHLAIDADVEDDGK
ncbi:MAG: hypothetical protein RIS70_2324 [Planctomycetota bacterium]